MDWKNGLTGTSSSSTSQMQSPASEMAKPHITMQAGDCLLESSLAKKVWAPGGQQVQEESAVRPHGQTYMGLR